MKIIHVAAVTTKNVFNQSFIIETLLGVCCIAFILTGLSLWQLINQPAPSPTYYTINNHGQLQPATTVQINPTLQVDTNQRAVLGEEISR